MNQASGDLANQNPNEISNEYLHELTVEEDALDAMNHVNNLVFLQWCLQSAGEHSKSVGWSWDRYRELGFGFIVRSHRIKYKSPAHLGDEIVVKTWVTGMERFSSKRRYHVIRQRDCRRLVEADGEVYNGNVGGRNAESHTSELAVELWDNLADSLGSTSGGRNNVATSGSTSSPVLATL